MIFPAMNNINRYSLLITIFLFIALLLYAQEPDNNTESDYLALYNTGNYTEALKLIKGKLKTIYNIKNDNQKFPTDDINIEKKIEKKKIYNLFRKKKIEMSFIEDNRELFTLHLYAARCLFKVNEDYASLNHYRQCLRYKYLKPLKDDFIFYEISQVYKNLGYYNAYIDTLETAYSLNPKNFNYSLELGKALTKTNKKRKAIFHLKRYIESKGDSIPEDIYLTLGNLNEEVGKYLETEKYYKKYLEIKGNDGYIAFALGYLSYKRTGNQKLALDCFGKSLQYLPKDDLFRRSKAAEYQGDINMQNLNYEKAIQSYMSTKIYHDKLKEEMDVNNNKVIKISEQLRNIKSTIKDRQLSDRYTEYQNLQEEKGKIELNAREMNYEFSKLNPGKIRWNLAEAFERTDKLNEAIQYYKEAIYYDYHSNNAREKIRKLKLKINRGY